MRFIFWQGIISIHQSAFIKALSAQYDVTLVVNQEVSPERRSQGWKVPDMGNANIIISPNKSQISHLLNDKTAYNIFSGFNPFPLANFALKKLASEKRSFSLFVEPYDWRGFKGLLRRIKYSMLAIRFRNNIHRLFVTGSIAADLYMKCGFDCNKIQQWGYFIENPTIIGLEDSDAKRYNIIFIGQLIELKNCAQLINSVHNLGDGYNLDIIGTGKLHDEIVEIIGSNTNISMLGNIPNREVINLLQKADILVLPSKYDGWGAVVNEALMVGTPVLASRNCGASILLDGNLRGESFNLSDMKSVIEKWYNKGKIKKDQRNYISNWASKNISGKSAAKYFVQAITKDNVIAPWINNH